VIATTGVRPLAESLDTIGIFARSVGDVALVSSSLMAMPEDDIPAASEFRFSFAASPVLSRAYPAAYSFISHIKDKLISSRVRWGERDLTAGYDDWSRLHCTILAYEASRNFADLIHDHPLAIGSELRTLVEAGSAVGQSKHELAQANSETQREIFDASLEDGEILLAPASPGEAPLHHEGTGSPIFNSAWTLLHVPCLTLPVARGAGQMPLGLQLIARRGADQHLLAAAKFLAGALSSWSESGKRIRN
jgi:Asp-tRNA(Asn)/Glu-tRNA(Gln) amidotransferase A subunit family amidase